MDIDSMIEKEKIIHRQRFDGLCKFWFGFNYSKLGFIVIFGLLFLIVMSLGDFPSNVLWWDQLLRSSFISLFSTWLLFFFLTTSKVEKLAKPTIKDLSVEEQHMRGLIPTILPTRTYWDETEEPEQQTRSRCITQRTKDIVWRRDEGKCSSCGSRENLEFDHIIPFSKGGSNTARNIELLCESCNRAKSDTIG